MKAKARETYPARVLRVGFEPSKPLDDAIGRFVGKKQGGHRQMAPFQSTTLRAVNLEGAGRDRYDEGVHTVTMGLRALGRHALQLTPELGVKSLPHALRLFFTPEDPEALENAVEKMDDISDAVTVTPRFSGLFVDLARNSLAYRDGKQMGTAVTELKETLGALQTNSSAIVHAPRLVVSDVPHFPRQPGA